MFKGCFQFSDCSHFSQADPVFLILEIASASCSFQFRTNMDWSSTAFCELSLQFPSPLQWKASGFLLPFQPLTMFVLTFLIVLIFLIPFFWFCKSFWRPAASSFKPILTDHPQEKVTCSTFCRNALQLFEFSIFFEFLVTVECHCIRIPYLLWNHTMFVAATAG